MRVFKTKWFNRWARKAGIADDTLCTIASELEQGIWDAHYGGGVYKKRVARQGEGKSGGYRTIIFFRKDERTFFEYAFPKNAKSDINEKEEKQLKANAADMLGYTDAQLRARIDEGSLIEINTEV